VAELVPIAAATRSTRRSRLFFLFIVDMVIFLLHSGREKARPMDGLLQGWGCRLMPQPSLNCFNCVRRGVGGGLQSCYAGPVKWLRPLAKWGKLG
jgi:hypothetical protein